MAAAWIKTAAPAIQNIAFASSTATFTSVAIGTASADRIVVVVIGIDEADGASCSSMTIGGVSATKAVEETHTSTSIWYAAVPTGTTATIVATYSGSIGVIGCCVGALTGVTATPTATSSLAYGFGGNPYNVTATVPTGGIGISGGFTLADNATTVSGSTLDYSTLGSGDGVFMAHSTTTGSVTAAYSVNGNFSGTALVMACWGPAAVAGQPFSKRMGGVQFATRNPNIW